MVSRTHRYANGGKVVKDHLTDAQRVEGLYQAMVARDKAKPPKPARINRVTAPPIKTKFE